MEVQTLQNIENKGYVNGVSKFIIDNLQKYSLYNRPIHYINDNEEKTVQIRDDNEWKQDTKWTSNDDIYLQQENQEDQEDQESILENTISEIDMKIYDGFQIHQTQTLNEHPRMKKILLSGAKTINYNDISGKILDVVTYRSV